MSYKDYLSNTLSEDHVPGSVHGHWEDGYQKLSSISNTALRQNWMYVATLRFDNVEFQLYQLKNNLEFVVGYFGHDETSDSTSRCPENCEERFLLAFRMKMIRRKTLDRLFSAKKVIEVKGVVVDVAFQGMNLAKTIYKYLVNESDYVLMSDSKQFFGARKLWSSLSRDFEVVVDVIDLTTGKYLRRNVTDLYQGSDDEDFDEKYWSYSNDKDEIRFLLKKVV
jgi:protein-tyrosine-phosphatase